MGLFLSQTGLVGSEGSSALPADRNVNGKIHPGKS